MIQLDGNGTMIKASDSSSTAEREAQNRQLFTCCPFLFHQVSEKQNQQKENSFFLLILIMSIVIKLTQFH